MTKTLTVRMDSELSAQLSACLDALGLTANAYFVMAAKQLVSQGRVPFELIVPTDVPTEETRAALVLAQAKELGIVSDDSPRFDTAEAAMAYLES
ncbi:MAG: type II toxin-antitoxin system RelB/DinJ family antitoxin [Atopobiaceae bacterium]|nr:type II toxin-antitoxin system RelB/DinJ family antitoxin [Atopobiaceae bacterium]